MFLDNADMDISPDSTPTSEPSYSSPIIGNNHPNNSVNNNNNLNHDEIMTSPNGHAKHPLNTTNSSSSLHHQMSNASSTSILSSSSKLNSAAVASNSNNKNSTTTSSSSPSTHNYSYSSHHLHRHHSTSPNDVNLSNSVAGGGSKGGGENDVSTINSLHHNTNSLRINSPTNPINNSSVSRLELNNSSSNSNHLGDGPPTPEMDLNSGSEHRRREQHFLCTIEYDIILFLKCS